MSRQEPQVSPGRAIDEEVGHGPEGGSERSWANLGLPELMDAIRSGELDLDTQAGWLAEQRLLRAGINRAEVLSEPSGDECPF